MVTCRFWSYFGCLRRKVTIFALIAQKHTRYFLGGYIINTKSHIYRCIHTLYCELGVKLPSRKSRAPYGNALVTWKGRMDQEWISTVWDNLVRQKVVHKLVVIVKTAAWLTGIFFSAELEHVRYPDLSEMTMLQYTDKQQETPLNRMKLLFHLLSKMFFFVYIATCLLNTRRGTLTKLNINML